MKCKDCKYLGDLATHFECYRYPPKRSTLRPIIKKDDPACGEFVSIKKKPELEHKAKTHQTFYSKR